MPSTLDKQNGKWCVRNADGSTAGQHDSRTDAIKQQRALLANESRYAELDARTQDWVEKIEPVQPVEERGSEYGQDRAFTALLAAVLARMDDLVVRLEVTERSNQSLTAAIQTLGSPVVNVAPPQVTVEAPQVTVEPQITVQQPERNGGRTVTFLRDPLSGQITKADVREDGYDAPVV